MNPSKPARITGWILTVLPAAMLLFSAAMKIAHPPGLAEGFTHLGWPDRYALPLGILEAACAIILLIPRTAVCGAVLVTGYLGGAVATHARIGELQCLLPAAFATLPWLGLYLRDPRLRALLPLRSKGA